MFCVCVPPQNINGRGDFPDQEKYRENATCKSFQSLSLQSAVVLDLAQGHFPRCLKLSSCTHGILFVGKAEFGLKSFDCAITPPPAQKQLIDPDILQVLG